MAQYECRTLLVTQADVSFLSLHGCKVKIISIFTSDYLGAIDDAMKRAGRVRSTLFFDLRNVKIRSLASGLVFCRNHRSLATAQRGYLAR
jgi:hypothetical protein